MDSLSEDEDLRAAIAASLNDAPPAPIAKNDTSRPVIDLTADSDSEVIPIYPKSKSVVSSEASREASAVDNVDDTDDNESDEDLKMAISMSLQGNSGQGPANMAPTSVPIEAQSQAREQTPVKGQTGPASGGLLGLDRKKMEEERLARLAKRKADSPTTGQREVKQPRTEAQAETSSARVPATPSPVQTTTGTVDAPAMPSSVPSIQFPAGTVKKTFAFGHRRSGDDIKIEEVLQTSDLELGVLSSFMWDIDWLFSKVNLAKNRLLLVMQAKTEAEKREYESDAAIWKGLRLCFPPMDGQINCMHSKLMLLFHPEYLRIAVPTANLTPFDWGEQGGVMENTVFIIDLPKIETSKNDTKTNFYNDLVYFLKATTLHENIIAKLEKFDFSKTEKFAFVHTIGGPHFGDSWQRTGYCGLGRSITSLGLQSNKPLNLDFVASSLGSLTSDFIKCIYLAAQGDSGLTELTIRTTKSFPVKSPSEPRRLLHANTADEWRDRFRIYYPSQETILRSKGGPDSAGTICFQEKYFENGKFPKHVLRDCVSTREGMIMHNKLLYVQPDEPIPVSDKSQCLGWAYVGSANLSESAWGRLVYDRSTKKPKLNCRNWECGVVVPVLKEKSSDSISESGSETEDEVEKQARKDKAKGAKRLGDFKEECENSLDIFKGVIPVPMRLPGQKIGGGARKPWYMTF
ncbi:tyrosyl-DNA phosphodiesterase-domain-containing protein [Aspergillus unguis]